LFECLPAEGSAPDNVTRFIPYYLGRYEKVCPFRESRLDELRHDVIRALLVLRKSFRLAENSSGGWAAHDVLIGNRSCFEPNQPCAWDCNNPVSSHNSNGMRCVVQNFFHTITKRKTPSPIGLGV
jgi:hypothetical protein